MKIEIFDYGMNGEGVAKIDGKIALTPFCLVGEIVDANIVKDEKNMCYANIKNIILPSPERVNPPCPYFYECGGCDLQHMSYTEQLKFKQLLIKKTIKKICGLDLAVNNTVGCSFQFNYRNKISLNLKGNKLGFFKQNSKDIVEIDNCMIASENLNKILKIFKNYLKIHKNYNDFIKNLVIREINSQILVGVVASKNLELIDFYKQLESEFNRIGLYQIVNTRRDSVVLSGRVTHVAGIKFIEISNFGVDYCVDLIGFHQTNTEIQNKIYEHVLNCISPTDFVVNGFSGQGLLSAIIAKKAKNVVGIEINKSSHLSAENLKKTNKIDNLTNICGDFNIKIKDYKNISTLVVDPAKKGCGKTVMEKIIGVKEIIYISCNPIALCKDINIIKDKYDIIEITPFDMFPNTKNVETVVRLKLKEN